MKKINQYLVDKTFHEFVGIITGMAIIVDIGLIIVLGFIAYAFDFFSNYDQTAAYRIFFGDESEPESFIRDLLGSGILAPILETIIFHIPFVTVLRKFPVDKSFILILTTISFSAIHVSKGLIALFLTLPGSFFIAYAYLRYIEDSFKKAVIAALLVHSFANIFMIVVMHTMEALFQ